MTNFLDNGTVLPHGLLEVNDQAMIGGFNKSYRNTALRVGVVVNSYPVNHSKNRSKLTTEYDVVVIEQNEDKGATNILYKNCMSSEGFGSIPDFFEKALRVRKKKSKGEATNLKDQNGAIALLMCLDGMFDKGFIIGFATHPNRKTTLVDEGPYLEGEYNGVNIKVAKNGSTTLTFKGATDNDGKVINNIGKTVATIEVDGSVQIKHLTATFRMDKLGDVTIDSFGNCNITCRNATIEGNSISLGKNAIESVIKGDTFKQLYDSHIHPTPIGPTGKPVLPLTPNALSKKVRTE